MIIIDDRAGSKGLADFPPMEGRHVLGRLDFGDAMLTGHGPESSTITIGVEVKSVSDLLSSVATGRLAGHQIPGLLKGYDHAVLDVHGECRPGINNMLQVRRGPKWSTYRIGSKPVPWSYIEGFLLTAQMFSPLRIKWCYDLYEVAVWLAVFDHWLEKPWEKHRGLAVFDKSREQSAPVGANPVETQIAKIAAALPAIDWVRGWAAAKHFESVTEMMDAGVDDWMEIPGFGPVIAKSAVDAIRRRKK